MGWADSTQDAQKDLLSHPPTHWHAKMCH